MIKAKKFRRRADDDDADTEENEKVLIKPALDKPSKEKEKEKAKVKSAPKSVGPQLLSFAEDEEYAATRETKSTSFSGKSSSRREKSKSKPGGKSSGGTLLSFDDDEKFGNGFSTQKVKKKSSGLGLGHGSSQRLGFGREKSAANLSLQSNVQPQAGEYTKEKLAELQRNTVRLGGPIPPVDNKPTEPVVVLKGLVKPVGVLNANLTDGIDRDLLGDASIQDAKDRIDRARDRDDRDRLRRDKDDAESRLGLMGIGAGAESGGVTHIPDAAAIAAAKAMRERARQAQSAPDYIALAPGDGADMRSKLRDSGLSRDQEDDVERQEDDSSADEGEIQGRLAFMGEKITAPKKRTGVFESAEERVAEGRPTLEPRDEDEEDEERRWEEEQLRKGFGKRVEETPARSAAAPVGTSQVQGPGSTTVVEPVTSGGGAGWGFGRALEGLSVTQQAEAAMRSLQESAQRLRETHTRTQSELYRTQENLTSSVQTVSALEKTLAAAGEKYIYMQELRDYISVLCDFLQHKAPVIEELEEHMQRLHEERANAITERRVGDNADELAEVEVAVGAAKAVLSKGGGTASATAAAVAAAAALSAREVSNMAPQLDEFGRDVNLQKRMESRLRAQRRQARASKKRANSMSSNNGDGTGQPVEGESSSDESESEMSAYQSRREEVLETAKSVFRDAAEEFAQLTKVKEKLEGWKAQFSSAYRDAYVSLSAPAIFAPYVRLELLQWDPLYGDAGFSNMHWYRQLYEYGMPPNGKELEPNDTDGDLVPKLVEKVALPVLHHEIAHCWDRLSTEGTRHAVAAVMDILIYVPATSDSLQELLGAVRSRMAEAVTAMEVPAWSLHVMTAVPKAAPIAAQKFGTAIRLLRNIAMWKDVLALPVLEQLALDELLSSKILPHLRTLLTTLHDAVTRTERVCSALSGVWVGPNRELSPKLASFVEYVILLSRAVEKKKDGGASPEDTIGLARRVKKMLVELNEYDRARHLAKHFQLKEAL
ncbi:GC-rich sequence DNA-binding factor [Marchantia polymorpha subsp. ruderalis]|uniref:GCF C-terminal domain-containing protein n=2 Tax=Marchantia polymorpha TaxID=3197 RepID=A0A176WP97_MARPO|nr:hypothetical protein AXG93_1587s1300 [Marchantia polymorpha subsp. ruderalis]PTQ30031.1 hypothetical protein MARPO_0131s0026 [Marchantia polymorpha]BBN20396.1 hypothetical protein Mp_8g18770 [Marchantia polymorpha subsp. ruderalis]|eukprot:PTQ30031.1 hypothetical protein MARPO_0131s0026 [Marchantia polymorpha]